jgi:hypothetical protein
MRDRQTQTASYYPPMGDAACEALIHRLLADEPALRSLYDDHVAANDELLPHVFFGDVTRFITGSFESDAHEARQDSLRVLAILEDALGQPEPSVEDLIATSFAENLLGASCLPALRRVFGPRLTNELARVEGSDVNP